jgi:predicted dehydrogenase
MLADDVPWWGRHYVKGVSGGGALASTAVHMLDLILWLAGSPRPLTATASMTTLFPAKRGAGAPAGAAAEYDAEDLVFGHVRCEGGFWLSIEGAWVWEGSGWNYSCDLVGDRAQARLDPLDVRGERDGKGLADLLPAGSAADTDFPSSVARELADVVAAVRGEREPVVTLEQALAVQAVTDALYRSAELGREVEVELP